MGDKSSEIKNLIKVIAGTDKVKQLYFEASVKSVEGETCTINYKGLSLEDVRLTAVVDGNKNNLLIIPKVGSMVTIVDLSQGELRDIAVMGFTEIESITINGGLNEGMVKVIELTNKLNILEQSINSLKNIFTAWTPAPGDGGLVLKTAVTNWAASQLTQTNKTEIQNDKIKH